MGGTFRGERGTVRLDEVVHVHIHGEPYAQEGNAELEMQPEPVRAQQLDPLGAGRAFGNEGGIDKAVPDELLVGMDDGRPREFEPHDSAGGACWNGLLVRMTVNLSHPVEKVVDGAVAAPLRIAIFSEVYWPMVSGVGVTLTRLADSLLDRGHAVRVYSATYHVPTDEDRPEVHRSASWPLFLYPDVQWGFPRHRELVADAKAFSPDVVHVATEFALGYAGLRVARALGVPMIASAHTDYQQYAALYRVQWALSPAWAYLRWFYSNASRVLCPSAIYAEQLARRGVSNTGIWSRGVDTRRFHPCHRSEIWRESIGAKPDTPVVVYVGRLAREKNLDLLVKAWPAIHARHPDARLVLVGRGPLEKELRKHEVAGVVLTGVLTGEALSAAYASADLFAFPSITETFGNVLLEAMASGLPSVAAAAGGVLEFAEHGSNSWLVEPSSVDALVRGIERLLDDQVLRRRLASGALATAAARRWDVIDDELFEEYRRLRERPRPADGAS